MPVHAKHEPAFFFSRASVNASLDLLRLIFIEPEPINTISSRKHELTQDLVVNNPGNNNTILKRAIKAIEQDSDYILKCFVNNKRIENK